MTMSRTTPNHVETVKQLFPNFSTADIQQKPGNNGIPFIIDDGTQKYWLKLIPAMQLEDVLKDIEKQALQDIQSPYVVELLEVKTKMVNGHRYDGLLFKYIDGDDLGSIFQSKKQSGEAFSEEEARKLLFDVSMGIEAISEKGWVHQDIKQRNIRYDSQNDRYVILDLGIAYYSRDLQSPTGKHNRDYASSEQAYASVDAQKIPLITFRSDISQLGQMAYELITLKNPFKDSGQSKLNLQRICSGEYQPIRELNTEISDDLVKIIDTMLNPHPGDRYRSPEDLLCALKGEQYNPISQFESGIYFQVWSGPHGYKKNIEEVTGEITGVVISASQMPAKDCISQIKENGLKLIFDPETHLLTNDIHDSWHGGLSNYDWYDFPIKPERFKNKSRIADFVAQVVQPQIELDVDYVIPPYFCIHNPDSEWRNLNGLFYYECLQYCRRIGFDRPVLCPIAVSDDVISVDRSRKDLVDYYTQLPDLDSFFLRIDAKEHNGTVRIIQATTKLIEDLERHKAVLLADAGTVVFGYLAKGLSACVTSLVASRRENDMSIKQVIKPTGGSYKEKFFMPKIFQFVKVDGDLPTLIGILDTDALCDCRVCKNANADSASLEQVNPNDFVSRWSKIDRGNHFFCCLTEWNDRIKLLSPEEKEEEYKKLIDASRSIYQNFSNDLIFNQIITQEDCADWEVAFFSQ